MDWTDELDEAIEQAFGHTDWRINDSKSVVVYREARTCYLQDQHFDCNCGSEYDNDDLVCECDQCINA
jgi:hypothetical protein